MERQIAPARIKATPFPMLKARAGWFYYRKRIPRQLRPAFQGKHELGPACRRHHPDRGGSADGRGSRDSLAIQESRPGCPRRPGPVAAALTSLGRLHYCESFTVVPESGRCSLLTKPERLTLGPNPEAEDNRSVVRRQVVAGSRNHSIRGVGGRRGR